MQILIGWYRKQQLKIMFCVPDLYNRWITDPCPNKMFCLYLGLHNGWVHYGGYKIVDAFDYFGSCGISYVTFLPWFKCLHSRFKNNTVSTGAISHRYAFYGQESGPIFMSNVNCIGSESHLVNCSHSTSSYSLRYCSHSSDVGVECPGEHTLDMSYSFSVHIIIFIY